MRKRHTTFSSIILKSYTDENQAFELFQRKLQPFALFSSLEVHKERLIYHVTEVYLKIKFLIKIYISEPPGSASIAETGHQL